MKNKSFMIETPKEIFVIGNRCFVDELMKDLKEVPDTLILSSNITLIAVSALEEIFYNIYKLNDNIDSICKLKLKCNPKIRDKLVEGQKEFIIKIAENTKCGDLVDMSTSEGLCIFDMKVCSKPECIICDKYLEYKREN